MTSFTDPHNPLWEEIVALQDQIHHEDTLRVLQAKLIVLMQDLDTMAAWAIKTRCEADKLLRRVEHELNRNLAS